MSVYVAAQDIDLAGETVPCMSIGITFCELPTDTQVPRGRRAAMACSTLAPNPTASKDTSTPRPSVSSRTLSDTSWRVGFTTTSAPMVFAKASRRSLRSLTRTREAPPRSQHRQNQQADGACTDHQHRAPRRPHPQPA